MLTLTRPIQEYFSKEDVAEAAVSPAGRERVYQLRNAQIQTVCRKYGLESPENGTNYYQDIQNTYQAPIPV